MEFDKIIVLICSSYFSFTYLSVEKYSNVYIFHFAMLFLQVLPTVNIENIYKDISRYLCFRHGANSGLEVGCFIVPLVLLSQTVFGNNNTFILSDNWQVYYQASIFMSLVTILLLLIIKGSRNLATFAIITLLLMASVTSTGFTLKTDDNELFLACCVCFYIVLFLLLIKLLPYSFTLGEAMIVTQTLLILFTDFISSIYYRLCFMFPSLQSLPVMVDQLPFTRTDNTFILQTLLVGILLTAFLLLPVFYYLTLLSDSIDLWVASLSFYAICLLSTISIFLPLLYITLGGINPLLWAYDFFFINPTRVHLIIFWCFVVLLAVITVLWRTHYKGNTECQIPNILTRKIFHILAVIIFITGIHYDPSLLHVSAAFVATIFLFLELLRVGRIKPFGHLLQCYLTPFVDERDSGRVILTHFYLLVGLSLPLWLCPLDYHKITKSGCEIILYSGVLSIGLGDAFASVIGVTFGSHTLPGTRKTVEGTFASILIQLIAITAFGIKVTNVKNVIAVITLSSLLEAFTSQIDNFLIPPFTYALFVMVSCQNG